MVIVVVDWVDRGFGHSNTKICWVHVITFFLRGADLRHMVVIRLGVELELELQAYATATETPDQSHICDLHHSS